MKVKVPLFILASFLIIAAILLFVKQVTYKQPQVVHTPSPTPVPFIDKAITIDLKSLGTAKWKGIATIKDTPGGKLVVTVTSNSTSETERPLFVQKGTCDNLGDITYIIGSVMEGIANITKEGSVGKLLASGQVSIVVHRSQNDLARPLACGEIVIK